VQLNLWGYQEYSSPAPSNPTMLLTSFVGYGSTSPKRQPVQISQHAVPSTLIFMDLAFILKDLLQQGALREALEVPFVRTYMVLYRAVKTYMVEVHGVAQKVSNNLLNSSYV